MGLEPPGARPPAFPEGSLSMISLLLRLPNDTPQLLARLARRLLALTPIPTPASGLEGVAVAVGDDRPTVELRELGRW